MKDILKKVPAILVMIALFTLSTLEGNDPLLNSINLSDKIEHFIAYFVLGITFCMWISREKWLSRPFLYGSLIVLLCTIFGASDEYHQTFVPGRSGNLYDLATDFMGGVIAVFAYFLFVKIKK